MSKSPQIAGQVAEHAVTCPECGSPMILRRTNKFLWKNGQGRLFYGCSRYPACRGIHGAHPNGKPLGVPGNKETKAARSRAHVQFDALQVERGWSKGKAYRWLGEQLGMKTRDEVKEKCHIAMFDVATCQQVEKLCAGERERAYDAMDVHPDYEASQGR